MSRLHEVRDLKAAVCKKLVKCAEQFNEKKEIVVRSENINGTYQEMVGCDETGQISNKQIVLFEYKNMQLTKFLDDRYACL